jgi:hypothetical protein
MVSFVKAVSPGILSLKRMLAKLYTESGAVCTPNPDPLDSIDLQPGRATDFFVESTAPCVWRRDYATTTMEPTKNED